ncbi:MAG: aldose epimerase family protein [Halieaceae bacterium]|jgi:aldose 1-epimerase|nr:aldose epimerase family protein [Halieaceae bacterium]
MTREGGPEGSAPNPGAVARESRPRTGSRPIAAEDLEERVLQNAHGDRITVLNFGARLTRIQLQLPGGARDVILGYENRAAYLSDPYFMGATVGRTCNRIAGASFNLDGIDYPLDANEGLNHLHGGAGGFHNRLWSIDASAPEDTVRFTLYSADGDQGYPGAVEASVTYRWTDTRELLVRVEAVTDRPTHVNMTNHSYFNLAGDGENVLAHRLRVAARHILKVDDDLLPTGDLLDLTGSVLDLRESMVLHDVIESRQPLIVRHRGLDFNYVLDETGAGAELESPSRDLRLHVRTTCPGLQVYSGQKLDSPFAPYRGMCLEPQHFPDTPNQPTFHGTLLVPGERYSQTTKYNFIAVG